MGQSNIMGQDWLFHSSGIISREILGRYVKAHFGDVFGHLNISHADGKVQFSIGIGSGLHTCFLVLDSRKDLGQLKELFFIIVVKLVTCACDKVFHLFQAGVESCANIKDNIWHCFTSMILNMEMSNIGES